MVLTSIIVEKDACYLMRSGLFDSVDHQTSPRIDFLSSRPYEMVLKGAGLLLCSLS